MCDGSVVGVVTGWSGVVGVVRGGVGGDEVISGGGWSVVFGSFGVVGDMIDGVGDVVG